MEELENSPIDVISARGKAGNGLVTLQQAILRSPAFEAQAHGDINLAPVLTNSTINIPVTVSLSEPIANKLNLVPANTSTNTAYVALPDFLALDQTLGDPHANINKMALLKLAASAFKFGGSGTNSNGGLIQQIGGELGGKIGGLLGGQKTNDSSGNNQNQSKTNSPVGRILKLFGR